MQTNGPCLLSLFVMAGCLAGMLALMFTAGAVDGTTTFGMVALGLGGLTGGGAALYNGEMDNRQKCPKCGGKSADRQYCDNPKCGAPFPKDERNFFQKKKRWTHQTFAALLILVMGVAAVSGADAGGTLALGLLSFAGVEMVAIYDIYKVQDNKTSVAYSQLTTDRLEKHDRVKEGTYDSFQAYMAAARKKKYLTSSDVRSQSSASTVASSYHGISTRDYGARGGGVPLFLDSRRRLSPVLRDLLAAINAQRDAPVIDPTPSSTSYGGDPHGMIPRIRRWRL